MDDRCRCMRVFGIIRFGSVAVQAAALFMGLGHLGGGYSEVAGALANGLAVVGNSTDGDDNDVSHAVVDATCFA